MDSGFVVWSDELVIVQDEMFIYISTGITPGDNFSGPRSTDANLSAKNWNQQQNNDGYSTQNWVNPQQPTASQWSPSAPAPDYGINSNDSEQIQIKPRRWF